MTRTGALWAGPIQHARFRVRVPIEAVDFMGPEQMRRTSVTKVVADGHKLAEVVYDVREFSPDYDLSFYFVPRQLVSTMDLEKPDLVPEGPVSARPSY